MALKDDIGISSICPPNQTPTQKFKIGFSLFDFQGIGSSLISFKCFVKLYYLSYSDSKFIYWVEKS